MLKSSLVINKFLVFLSSTSLIGAGLIGCSKTNFSPVEMNDGLSKKTDSSISENFVVNDEKPRTPVDIVFIIDNSRSMYEEQTKLSTRLNHFVNNLGKIDWQIGLTTTDMSGGPYSTNGVLVDIEPNSGTGKTKALTAASTDYQKSFSTAIEKYGTPRDCNETGANCPSGYEQPMNALYKSIQKQFSDNQNFYRSNADLAVIIISDEDEEVQTGDAMTATHLTSFMRSVFGPNKRMNVYGIIHKPNDEDCLNSDSEGARYGANIDALTRLTSGYSLSICEPDYAKPLSEIGERVARKEYSINLKEIPNKEKIKIKLIPEQLQLSWRIDQNKIIFTDWPQKGTQIVIDYEKDSE